MLWQSSPFALPLLVAATIALSIMLLAWFRRETSGALALAILMLGVTEWAASYAMELGTPGLASKVLWAKVQYLGIVLVPTAWLLIVLEFTGRERYLTRRNLILFSLMPTIILLLVWTNDLHGLIWTSARLQTEKWTLLSLGHGPAFWVHAIYSYSLLLLGTVLIIQASFHTPSIYRGRTTVLILGALVPWIGNLSYLARWFPSFPIDPTPFAFTITGAVYFWGLYRLRLLDVVPVARHAVLEDMDEGMIVLDIRDHVADLNPAALRIINRPKAKILGQPAGQAFAGHSGLATCYQQAMPVHSEIRPGEKAKQVVSMSCASPPSTTIVAISRDA